MPQTPRVPPLRACCLLLLAGFGLVGCASGLGPAPAPAAAPLPHLRLHTRLVAFLPAGESHHYLLPVRRGTLVRLTVERGLRPDLAVSVTGPDGATVLARSPVEDWPGFSRAFAAETGGRYLVEVSAGHGEAPHPARYAVTVSEARPLRHSDAELLAGEAAFVAAMSSDALTPESFATAEEHFRRAGSQAGLAAVALERGFVLHNEGRPQEALREAEAAAAIFAATGNRLWQGVAEAKAATLEAEPAQRHRRFARAAELLAGGDPDQLSSVHHNWALSLREEDFYQEARDQWIAALPLRGAAGDICGQVRVLTAIGSVERPLGLLTSTEGRYEEAMALLSDTECIERELDTLRLNRAVLARYQGEPQRALDALRDLETELETSWSASCGAGGQESVTCQDDTGLLIGTYGNLGFLLSDLGQLEAALERHEKALALGGSDWYRVAKAWTLHELGRLAEAERELRAALASALPTSNIRAFSLHGLGRLAREQGRLEEARDLLEQALALHRERGTESGLVGVLQELGALEIESGNLGAAAVYVEQAVAASADGQDPERHARSMMIQAQLRRRLGELAAARESYAEALRLREEQRTAVRRIDLRISFVERWSALYEEYVGLLMELHARQPGAGFARQAFEVNERTRARSLAELLREAEIDVLARIDEDLAGRYRTALGHLASVTTRLSYLTDSPADAAAVEEDRAELRRRRDELRAVQAAIAAAYPSYADLVAPVSPSLGELQAGLGAGDALLEYSLGDRRSVLFVVTREAFAAVPLEVSAGHLGALVAAALPVDELDPGDGRAAAELYDWLIAPAEPWLAPKQRLLVVPDRELHRLPFELLRRPEGGTGAEPYLLSRWEVAYTPSATVLRSLAEAGESPAPAGLDFVAFAPSFGETNVAALRGSAAAESAPPAALLHAREEVETIARTLYPDSSKLYVDREAKESRVKTDPEVHRARRLHFATHGVAGARAELLGLLLPEGPAEAAGNGRAAAAAEDGRLGLDEIFELDLDAELVVLSACETARGEQTRVEGLVGFGRAFFAAGAPSVVASLWKVSDRSTAPLMEELYRQLEAGAGKAAALRQAKLRLMADNWASPYFWAPFILLGQPD